MQCEVFMPNGDLKRERWVFDLSVDSFQPVIRLNYYQFQERQSKRHKFVVQTRWERWDKRQNSIENPPLPLEVIGDMKARFIETIHKTSVSV